MNLYMNLMNKTIEYIEANIFNPLTLLTISKEFHLSAYHFDRLFNVIVGISLKQYILGRKLSLALERLDNSQDSVMDIALDFGFEYPEVFSRAFKKQFGVSPKAYRREKPKVDRVEKACVITRAIVNYQGGLTLKASYVNLEPLRLEGISVEVDTNDTNFEFILNGTGEKFIDESKNLTHLKQDKFYSLVNCHGEDTSIYTVFFGRETHHDPKEKMKFRIVPRGWYASFRYQGDMMEMRSTLEDDIFKWIDMKEIELNANGIGMICVYDEDYLESQIVQILVPIRMPKS